MNKRVVWAITSLLVLGGCSMFEPSRQWRQAEVAAPLEIPAQMDTPGTSAEMKIPGLGSEPPALITDKSPPVLDQGLSVQLRPDKAWQRLGPTLRQADIGKVVASSADELSYRVEISGAELAAEEDRGFFSGLFHDGPDPERSYYAHVTVVGNGDQSQLQISGDALAVLRLREVLKDGLLKTP